MSCFSSVALAATALCSPLLVHPVFGQSSVGVPASPPIISPCDVATDREIRVTLMDPFGAIVGKPLPPTRMHLPSSDIVRLETHCAPVHQGAIEGWVVSVKLTGPHYSGNNPAIGAKGDQFIVTLGTAPGKSGRELFFHIPRTSLGMHYGLVLFREDQF